MRKLLLALLVLSGCYYYPPQQDYWVGIYEQPTAPSIPQYGYAQPTYYRTPVVRTVAGYHRPSCFGPLKRPYIDTQPKNTRSARATAANRGKKAKKKEPEVLVQMEKELEAVRKYLNTPRSLEDALREYKAAKELRWKQIQEEYRRRQ